MKQIRGNLWNLPGDIVCITTNGYVKTNGAAVMGRGCAREARDRHPGFDMRLGARITHLGNHVHHFPMFDEHDLVSFPVKHTWQEDGSIELITRSAHELVALANEHPAWHTILLPRPGCGNGRLQWSTVEQILTPILDDRISIVTF